MTLAVLPLMIPLVTAIAALAARNAGHRVQAGLGVVGAAAHLGVALALFVQVRAHGVVKVQMGEWPAPFGIALHADLLAAIMLVLTGIVGLAGAAYSLGEIRPRATKLGYVPLMQLLIMGVSGAFLTADLFNLFVWFEVMLLSSFVLLALGGGDGPESDSERAAQDQGRADGRVSIRAQMRGALYYVAINLLSSALFLVAVGLIYAVAHTLDMNHLAYRLTSVSESHPFLVLAMATLLLVSFGIKAGLVPLFAWLPASYHTPPVAVSAVFAGLLTKVGVYALIRVFASVFPPMPELFTVILVAAGLTMLVGVLGAVAQYEIRRILSFHIISQIGYIVIGVGLLASPDPALRALGLTAAIFYMAHHILVKANLFFIGGLIARLSGSEHLSRIGGLAKRAPWLALLFAVPALSLAGIPPLSGFWAKLAVFQSTLQAEHYALAAVAAVAGLLTLLSMLKIWNGAFWKPAPANSDSTSESTPASAPADRWGLAAMIVPAAVLALMTAAIGLAPGWLFEVCSDAARAILQRELLITGAMQ